MVGVWFVTPDGRDIVADVYDRIVPAADWLEQTICFRAHADAAHARIRLHAGELPLLVRDLSVEEIPAPAAAALPRGATAVSLLSTALAPDPGTLKRTVTDGTPLPLASRTVADSCDTKPP